MPVKGQYQTEKDTIKKTLSNAYQNGTIKWGKTPQRKRHYQNKDIIKCQSYGKGNYQKDTIKCQLKSSGKRHYWKNTIKCLAKGTIE